MQGGRPGIRRRPVTSTERVPAFPTPLVVTVIPMSSLRPSVPITSGRPTGPPQVRRGHSSMAFFDWSGNQIPWPSPTTNMSGTYSRSVTPSIFQGPWTKNLQRTPGHGFSLLRDRSSLTKGERRIQSGVHQSRTPILRDTFDSPVDTSHDRTGLSPRNRKSSKDFHKKPPKDSGPPPPSPSRRHKNFVMALGPTGRGSPQLDQLSLTSSYNVIPNISKKVNIVVPTSESPINNDYFVNEQYSEEDCASDEACHWDTSEHDNTSHAPINSAQYDP